MGSSSSRHRPNLTDRSAPLSRSVSFPSYTGSEGVISDHIAYTSSRQDYQSNDMFEGSVSMNQHAGHERYSRLKPKDQDRTISLPGERSGLRRSPGGNGLGCRGNEEDETKAAFNALTSCCPLQKASCDEGLPILENKLSAKVRANESFRGCTDSGRSSSFRCAESLDPNTGLRLLLSPVATPSRSIASSSRFGNLTKTLSSSRRLDQNVNDDMDFSSRAPQSLSVHERSSSPFEIEGMGDSEEPGSPLFDPAILATFEMAIEASSDDTWPSSEVSTSSSSRVVCSSLDMCSDDADSANCTAECGFVPEASESMHSESGDAPRQREVSTKRDTDSNSVPFFEIKQIRMAHLEDFEPKYPPYCEDKIVLYFTSLRGIRKTYENCCLVRLILKGFGVHVDERDIWMHSKFKEELANIMGATLPVPRLFIKGRYIGGADDVKRLHEEGVLQNLLEGLPAECDSMCDVCGSMRFLPCTTCSGSCKMVSTDEISRCPDCNENGLILCPSCSQ